MTENAGLLPGIEALRTELLNTLAPMQARLDRMQDTLAPMQAQLDGMPLLHRNLTTTQSEVRMLTAAFNDFAKTNVTKGEIDALHADVNRVEAENATLAVRMETAEAADPRASTYGRSAQLNPIGG
jgi:hypothetical protein